MVDISGMYSDKSKTCFCIWKHISRTMSSVILAVTILVIPFNLYSQKQKTTSVFLKTGDVVYGKIIKNDSVSGILIENDCGINLIKHSDIDSIKFSKDVIYSLQKTKGFFNLSSLALLFGEGRDGYVPVPSLTMVNGYQFNKHFFGGLGIGFEYYDFGVLPLFLDAKYKFTSKGFSPFLSIKVGGSIPLQRYMEQNWEGEQNKTYGGVLFSPEIGIMLPVGQNDAFLISVGYHYQQLSYNSPTYYWYLPEQSHSTRRVFTNYNRISLRVGFLFR
jgi:hypothetical protein